MGHAENISFAVDAAREAAWNDYTDDQEWCEAQDASAWDDACAITNSPIALADFLRDRADYIGLCDPDVIRIGGPKYCLFDAALICATLPPEARECIAGDITDELRRRIAADLVSRVTT